MTEQDYIHAAGLIGCEVAAIKAVAEIESAGSGFLASGKPLILFEGHVFWSQLKKAGINPLQYVSGNEDVLYEKWTKKYYRGGEKEYDRLEKAVRVNRNAALASASWGKFQIMGYNFPACGFSSLQDFINAMYSSEGRQLTAFVNFIKNKGLADELIYKRWADFARQYNGAGYKANRYDEKLATAYKKYS